jgi:hypothetical protein
LLVPEPKLVDELAIGLEVRPLQVVEVTAALADHLEETAATVVVLGVLTEVIGEIIDPFRQYSDLDLGGAGVGGVLAILVDRGRLYEGHDKLI